MLEDEGHWIKLMRTATLPTDANICLRISGKDIVCTVTKDVNKEVELKVTCRIADPGDDQEPDFTKHKSAPNSPKSEREICSDDETQVKNSPDTMLDFILDRAHNFNGNMSSRKSEERSRDMQYERNTRSENTASDSDCGVDDVNEVTSSTVHESPSSEEFVGRKERTKNEDETRITPKPLESGVEHRNRANEEGVSYRCSVCDFPCFDRHTFEKHVRSHHDTPGHRTTSSLTNPRSFCDACKIQFMSVNTYHVHKKYYCKSRHESDDVLNSASAVEAASGNVSAAFRPSSDTVILRGDINGSVTPSIIQPQAIYAAISTNPLILLPCSLVSGQGLVPQNGVIPTGGPGIVLQTGIACPTIVEKSVKSSEESESSLKITHPEMNVIVNSAEKIVPNTWKNAPIKRKISEGDVLNLKKTCISDDRPSPISDTSHQDLEKMDIEQESPLDLSLKKKKLAALSPIKRRNSSASMGRPSPPLRVGTTSTPPGPSVSHGSVSPSNSYSSESNPCYASHVPVVVQRLSQGASERISPLPPVLQAAVAGDKAVTTPGMLPPKLLKQGNNICEECHIVFYKYDNYLAHKKHYCAYRRQQLSALAAAAAAAAASAQQEHSSDDTNSNHSGGNETTVSQQDDSPKPAIRRMEYPVDHFRPVISKIPQSVFCCDACGVKFSTQDNLNAHQTYYCIKKADSAMSKAGKKGDGDGNQKTIESPFLGPEEWKCNYCDVTGSSYEVIRRHLLTHTELRGFRCLVCGYKGNTWRGMRTHACEHLTEDGTSLEDFMSSTVITESGGIPVMSRTVDCSDEDSDTSRDTKTRERTSSNTSESMKETSLLRRELLATDHSGSEELTNSPRNSDYAQKDSVPKRATPIKAESGDSSLEANVHQETVNPLAFCDVVIKSDNGSGDDGSRERQARSTVKVEQESDYDSDEKHRDGSASPPTPSRSVIRMASDHEVAEDASPPVNPPKKKGRSQTKPNIELKYCKSCDISFYHLSNFLAHKKYYCVSRVIQNCLPEAATVQ